METERPVLSERKLAANRENAKKCTGPKTPAGKARVRLNAFKHGRFANWFHKSLVAVDDDPEEFEALRREFLDTYHAPNALLAMQVNELAFLHWELRQIRQMRASARQREIERMKQEQLWRKRQIEKPIYDAVDTQIPDGGVLGARRHPEHFKRGLICLNLLLEMAEKRDFSYGWERVVYVLYADQAGTRGYVIKQLLDQQARQLAQGGEPDGEIWEKIKRLLLEEKDEVAQAYEAFKPEYVKISGAEREARLEKVAAGLARFERREEALGKAIDRKLKILMTYQAAPPEPGEAEEPDEVEELMATSESQSADPNAGPERVSTTGETDLVEPDSPQNSGEEPLQKEAVLAEQNQEAAHSQRSTKRAPKQDQTLAGQPADLNPGEEWANTTDETDVDDPDSP